MNRSFSYEIVANNGADKVHIKYQSSCGSTALYNIIVRLSIDREHIQIVHSNYLHIRLNKSGYVHIANPTSMDFQLYSDGELETINTVLVMLRNNNYDNHISSAMLQPTSGATSLDEFARIIGDLYIKINKCINHTFNRYCDNDTKRISFMYRSSDNIFALMNVHNKFMFHLDDLGNISDVSLTSINDTRIKLSDELLDKFIEIGTMSGATSASCKLENMANIIINSIAAESIDIIRDGFINMKRAIN